ncbi:MAG: hypothetical protein L0H84_24150 [Pseudonocardia sp.]|nr:hypothetical protein [Pseudonocardia sp.]
MTDLPMLLTAAVVILCLALALAIAAALHRGALATGYPLARARTLAGIAALVLVGWLTATAALAAAGRYIADPWLGVGVAAPLVLGLLALRLPAITAVREGAHAVAVLAALQTLRVVGGAFLVLLAADRVPAGFALPSGIGDVLVGLAAPAVAYALWRRPTRRVLGIAFNVLGLLDLALAIPLGLLHAPGRLQLIVTDPTTALMGTFPMALVPTFVVPLAIVAHIASLRLLTRPRSQPPPPQNRRMLDHA